MNKFNYRIVYIMGTPLVFVVLVAMLTVYDLYRNVVHIARLVRDGWRAI